MDAPDGRAGLALWQQTSGDLVLTDIFMPDTDGIEVIVQFSRLWPGTKIIAMTGGAKTIDLMSTVAPATFQLGARRLLMKPFTIPAILAALSAVLNPREGTRTEDSRTETPVSLTGVLR